MALVLSGQGEKASPVLQFARKYCAHIGYFLGLLGFLWLLVLPTQSLSRRTYLSENAMMPGQVDVGFGSSKHLDAMQSVEHHGQDMQKVFGQLGLDSEVQRIDGGGINVHGVLRAPRSDAVEALVVAAAWDTRNGTNTDAVRLLAGLAQYTAEQVYWAKDIIFLVTDSGERGVEAWLRAYHGEGGVLRERSGLIQAALALEMPLAGAYTGLALHFEGRSGQLPNLDFLNIVKHVARQEKLPVYYHGLPDMPGRAPGVEQYLRSARLLLSQVRAQAVGSSVGVHAPFLHYGIDALTVVGLQAGGGRARDLVAVGRTVEGTLRSLNNLLERFHQSFFFYLLSGNGGFSKSGLFISIGNYVPAAVLLAAALMFHAMDLWWRQGPDVTRAESPKDRITRINTYHGFLRSTLPGSIALMVRVHVLGALLFAIPFVVPKVVVSDSTTTGYMFTMFVASVTLMLHLSDSMWNPKVASDWRQLKALVAVYVAWVVALLAVMNFSLALAMFAVVGLPLMLTRAADEQTRWTRGCTLLMLAAFSPMVVLTAIRYLVGSEAVGGSSSLFKTFLSDYSLFGSPVYPLVCLVYWPVNVLCMVIALMP
ncbi:Glycosyl phosphatidyl inositol protein transamidase complex subunit [Coemansia erecta]|uniref:Glycosyl phosphatidyl inositol protein transamidase complex subunit n=1 Tax=Coemansia erecta TaxID=147472 RepID=A0A9W7Y1S8_9FUNG|nr:Glycosyl phosphatidyl inositol protein transamidase complex subunit [Coemansia erecta]